MGRLARQVATVRLEEGLARQGAAHRTLIGVFLDHAFSQNATEEARDNYFFSSRLDASPSGHVFLENDRDIAELGFHGKNIVCAESRGKRIVETLVVEMGDNSSVWHAIQSYPQPQQRSLVDAWIGAS